MGLTLELVEFLQPDHVRISLLDLRSKHLRPLRGASGGDLAERLHNGGVECRGVEWIGSRCDQHRGEIGPDELVLSHHIDVRCCGQRGGADQRGTEKARKVGFHGILLREERRLRSRWAAELERGVSCAKQLCALACAPVNPAN